MTKLRPFRFACLVADARQRTGEDWEALAARAEALGYDTFGVFDHFGTPHAPLQVLQWVASCTSRIRLATLVLDNDFRHPAVLAKEAATLDVLSNGRLELGMGAGWKSDDYERSGIPQRRGRSTRSQPRHRGFVRRRATARSSFISIPTSWPSGTIGRRRSGGWPMRRSLIPSTSIGRPTSWPGPSRRSSTTWNACVRSPGSPTSRSRPNTLRRSRPSHQSWGPAAARVPIRAR